MGDACRPPFLDIGSSPYAAVCRQKGVWIVANEKQLNRDLIIGWAVIVMVLFIAYLGEVLKGERSIVYALVFMAATGLPALLCWLTYQKNPLNHNLRYLIVAGYFIMYLFVMVSGNTMLVFTYILPLLSLLILYHQPKLILVTGLVTFVINLVQIAVRFMDKEIMLENSRDVEIQIALLALCFGGSFIASRLYDDIYTKNEEYVRLLDEKSRQIQRMTLQTIETIANTIDAKDEYTKGHSKRVSEYSAKLAEYLGMEEEEVLQIRYVALLHDIGKIGVPDSVLNKPGKLTDAEYELMKTHTLIGGEILKDIGMLPDLDVGAKFHHERYDGKGYPNGLKGQEIPLTARIICIADSYDAMTSNRVYRRHLSREVVLKEIRRCRGTQFDPDVTDAFLRYLEKESPWEYREEEGEQEMLANVSGRLLQKIVHSQSRQAAMEAEQDELTMVYNRTAAERKIQANMQENCGSLFLVDLDNMRRVNQRYGFRRGDYYLQTVAKLLKEFAENIIVSRFSGDEFLCFMPDVTDREAIRGKMDDFVEKVHRYKETDELLSSLSISIGITIYEKGKQELQQLLVEADKAMYHVKQEEKDGYYFYRMDEDAQEYISKVDLSNLIQAIRRKDSFSNETVLAHKEFFRVYDFILDVVSGSGRNIQLILFTAKLADENSMSVEEREDVMRIIECAIIDTLKDENAVTKYSSVQRIVMMMGEETENLSEVTNAIVKDFYRMYDKKDVELCYDIARLGGDSQENVMES